MVLNLLLQWVPHPLILQTYEGFGNTTISIGWVRLTQFQSILCTNKTINHWPFQEWLASISQPHLRWLWEDAELGFYNLEGLGDVILLCYIIPIISKSLRRIRLITINHHYVEVKWNCNNCYSTIENKKIYRSKNQFTMAHLNIGLCPHELFLNIINLWTTTILGLCNNFHVFCLPSCRFEPLHTQL